MHHNQISNIEIVFANPVRIALADLEFEFEITGFDMDVIGAQVYGINVFNDAPAVFDNEAHAPLLRRIAEHVDTILQTLGVHINFVWSGDSADFDHLPDSTGNPFVFVIEGTGTGDESAINEFLAVPGARVTVDPDAPAPVGDTDEPAEEVVCQGTEAEVIVAPWGHGDGSQWCVNTRARADMGYSEAELTVAVRDTCEAARATARAIGAALA